MPDISISIVLWPVMLAAAYLLGAIPFAHVLARINGVDLRTVGSQNVGAGNLTKSVGAGWGTAAGVLDGLKGLVPVLIARASGLGLGAAGLVGVAAVMGHNWSIFMRGRSGRGLATSVGVALALDPVLLVWTTGWAVAGWKIGGGLGGFLGWGLLPIVSVSLGRPVTESLVILLLSTILMLRRAQGNPGDDLSTADALGRVVYDNDRLPGDVRDSAEDPLTP